MPIFLIFSFFCVFCFLLSSYAWFLINLMTFKVSDNPIVRTFSFPATESAVYGFVFFNVYSCHYVFTSSLKDFVMYFILFSYQCQLILYTSKKNVFLCRNICFFAFRIQKYVVLIYTFIYLWRYI